MEREGAVVKPCPFCGSAAVIDSSKLPTRREDVVLCWDCGAMGPAKQGVEGWNRRAPDGEVPR